MPVQDEVSWASVASVCVFLRRFRLAKVSCARGLGGDVEVPSWIVSTVRRGCFLGRPRFLLMGVRTVRLSVLVYSGLEGVMGKADGGSAMLDKGPRCSL